MKCGNATRVEAHLLRLGPFLLGQILVLHRGIDRLACEQPATDFIPASIGSTAHQFRFAEGGEAPLGHRANLLEEYPPASGLYLRGKLSQDRRTVLPIARGATEPIHEGRRLGEDGQ